MPVPTGGFATLPALDRRNRAVGRDRRSGEIHRRCLLAARSWLCKIFEIFAISAISCAARVGDCPARVLPVPRPDLRRRSNRSRNFRCRSAESTQSACFTVSAVWPFRRDSAVPAELPGSRSSVVPKPKVSVSVHCRRGVVPSSLPRFPRISRPRCPA